MIFDDETLMAYADGELDRITAKRVEKAIATDPVVAERVAAQRSLREKIGEAYPLASQPDPLADLIRTHKVVQVPVRQPSSRPRWLQAAALAACLVAGVALGRLWQDGQLDHSSGGTLVASGPLAGALETQLASTAGDTRMLVSFRNRKDDLCRVFEGQAIDGIACKNGDGWQLLSTQSGGRQGGTAYRQAGSANGALMSEAQDMMAGNPFSEADEKRARALKWSLEK